MPNVPSGRTTISTKYVDERTGEPTANFPSGDVSSLVNRVITLETDFSVLNDDVTRLDTTVATLESDVGSLQSDTSGLENRISLNETEVNRLQLRVSALEAKAFYLSLLASITSTNFISLLSAQVGSTTSLTGLGSTLIENELVSSCSISVSGGSLSISFLASINVTDVSNTYSIYGTVGFYMNSTFYKFEVDGTIYPDNVDEGMLSDLNFTRL